MASADRFGETEFTAGERKLYAEQLARVLASPYFHNSKRYPALLRHIVQETLAGRVADLRERPLGVSVFGREVDYDSNADPIVRVTAGEIRRRLAQYYHEPEHAAEPRIDLPSGSYVPELSPPPAPSEVEEAAAAPANPPSLRRWPTFAAGFCSAVLLVALVLCALGWRYAHRPEEMFWRPFAKSRSPILVCVGQPNVYMRSLLYNGADKRMGQLGVHMLTQDNLVMGDAVAAANLIASLSRRQIAYQLMGANDASYEDVRRGPLVLVSGSDNPWTMRLTSPLRYRFSFTPPMAASITDSRGEQHPEWRVDFSEPYDSLTQDYALVARFQDPTTGQMVVVIAGLGVNGTISASELVSNPNSMRELFAQLPSGAANRNFELVIGTQVVSGHSGPPRLLAAEIW